MLTAYTMMNKLRKKIKPVAQLPQQVGWLAVAVAVAVLWMCLCCDGVVALLDVR